MRSTLFYIPSELNLPGLGSVPLFGYGLLLVLWAILSVVLLAVLVRRQGFNADTRGYLPVLGLLGLVIAYLLPLVADERGLPIRGYGLMLLVAVVSGVGVAMYRARRMGVDPELIMSLALWLFVGGLVGGRMFYVIEYWDRDFSPQAQMRQAAEERIDSGTPDTDDEPTLTWSQAVRGTVQRVIRIDTGGLVVYGALLCGGAALLGFIYRYHVPGLALADLIAPSVALGLGLGRVGCFLNGCCFGGMCELPWAVEFPAGSPPHEQQVHLAQVYGVTIARNSEDQPVIGPVPRDSAIAHLGLGQGIHIVKINGHDVSTFEDAQQAAVGAFRADAPLELTTAAARIFRFSLLPGMHQHSRSVHPAQLYSTIDALLLCMFLIAYYPYRQRDGEVAALTLILHPISRFLLEIIRTDEGPIFGTGLSISQNISLLVLVGGVALWFYLLRRPRGTVWPVAVPA